MIIKVDVDGSVCGHNEEHNEEQKKAHFRFWNHGTSWRA